MSLQIQRTISLIKKSYDQPIIFHLLYSHLMHLSSSATPLYDPQDDWAQILITSCSGNKLPNQGIETKITSLLKNIRPPFKESSDKLKCMVVCCYMLNRPVHLINHIAIFELVMNFMGVSDYFDGLILTILSRLLTARAFGLERNKKLSMEGVGRMLDLISSYKLSSENTTKALICFIESGNRPPTIGLLDIQPTFSSYKFLECLGLYVKYAHSTEHIGDVVPSHPALLAGLEQFMNSEYLFEISEFPPPQACVSDNRAVFGVLLDAFNASTDKRRFIDDAAQFIAKLNDRLV
ncbi:hypothetical protein PAEPH01_0727 [Pancytospora epiphaga]|nr:hypothetical protein PAEPH01_0727 [Pancytospora epiphaga]